MIPLAQVFALEFTSPLWVLVLSPLILGERMTQGARLAAVIGFTGILIVARPGPETINAGTLAAAAGGIGFAGLDPRHQAADAHRDADLHPVLDDPHADRLRPDLRRDRRRYRPALACLGAVALSSSAVPG